MYCVQLDSQSSFHFGASEQFRERSAPFRLLGHFSDFSAAVVWPQVQCGRVGCLPSDWLHAPLPPGLPCDNTAGTGGCSTLARLFARRKSLPLSRGICRLLCRTAPGVSSHLTYTLGPPPSSPLLPPPAAAFHSRSWLVVFRFPAPPSSCANLLRVLLVVGGMVAAYVFLGG
jgi:hypothetical protein